MTGEARGRAVAARDSLKRWLFDQALPLWSTAGTDWAGGGFFETIDLQGAPSDEPRRTRVVGRQIYAFAVSGGIGWDGPADALVDHGLAYLRRCCLKPDGTVVSASCPDGTVVDGRFDLYDHAFALFGLAAAAAGRPGGGALAAAAARMRDRMKAGWSHPVAGFEESVPPTLPLKANPHMHMLEASLAWIEAGTERDLGDWDALADEIAELCLGRFIDPASGALREFFDHDWRPAAGEEGRIVEPGHQFEWAWLLRRWGALRGRSDATRAARRLVDLAEEHGVDRERDLAIMEIRDDFTVKDDTARLWQQTERIKAWLAMAEIADTPETRERAWAKVADAAAGLERYFTFPIAGGAWENFQGDGSFRAENARASSLYHIVCAIAEMQRVLG